MSVNVQAVLPEGRNILWGFHATPVQADGTFAVDHVPVGHVRVLLMSGSAAFSQSVQTAEADVRDGETTPVDFVSREILVSGRITRSNVPAPGLHVEMRGNVMMMMVSGAGGSEVPVAPTGPQHGKAVSAEDGAYALILDAPGSYRASIESADNKSSFGARQLDVPDAETFAFDADIGGAPLTGLVVDKASEAPVAARKSTRLPRPATADERRSARTGGDRAAFSSTSRRRLHGERGRRGICLEPPGNRRWRCWWRRPAYAGCAASRSAGAWSLRRVSPRGGCPVSVKALNKEGLETFVITIADGSFEIKGLPSGSYALTAGSSLAGFAMEPSVAAGASDLALTLQPGGTARLRVRGTDGAPVSGAYASVTKLGGVPASFNSFEGGSESDAQGVLSANVPEGAVELTVRKNKLKGTVTVNVPAAGSAAGDVVLAPE